MKEKAVTNADGSAGAKWTAPVLIQSELFSTDLQTVLGILNHLREPMADTAAQLEEFSDSSDSGLSAEEWIRRLEISRDVGQWSENRTRSVILSKFKGRARLWHVHHGIHLKTYDKWRAEFLVFSSPKPGMSAGHIRDRILLDRSFAQNPANSFILTSQACQRTLMGVLI